ncbi:CinA family protein [Chitinimonas sp. BJB300]|uniref:CinA family protein n=1 Tax=Chitinimonas sp. BJB300 TaxID=1559339 RepID=UPI000C1210F6|nr:CinA family protein [Chitinimonas sp. BJB300]PHV10784.1 damage-inducible protein CinA [Chitinimonas sp. BJB300]TSJ84519.1 CinA family protein [Chitinimonas sp. BJB300]
MSLPHTIIGLAEQLGRMLAVRHLHVTAGESCTGGGIANAITEIPGSSGWFDMAFVTYSNEAKCRLLGVPEAALAKFGAVSEEVAQAMAFGALQSAKADIAVAVSGIAGPSGGTAEKPVGTVCFAWAFGRQLESETRHFAGDRTQVREQTIEHALRGLIQYLNKVDS